MSEKKIIALGFFDGVHLGHQALLRNCLRLADEHECSSAAVTFETHPQMLIKGESPKMINTGDDRERLLKQFGIKNVIRLPFDERIRTMLWRDFLNLLVEEYGANGFVCGDDFRFGYRGQGNASLLREYCDLKGYPCVIVEEQILDEHRISSTYIRQLIENGRMESACRYLGHPHILTGTVVQGRQLGHRLGFPTANVLFPEGVICPLKGVYSSRICLDGEVWTAVTNVGSRPTVGGHQIRMESWILDYTGDLYGREITIEFYRFLRPERRFDDLDELRTAVQNDALETRKYFRKN